MGIKTKYKIDFGETTRVMLNPDDNSGKTSLSKNDEIIRINSIYLRAINSYGTGDVEDKTNIIKKGKNFVDITGHVIATIELTKGFQLDRFKSAIEDSSMGLVIVSFSAKLEGEDDNLNFINDGLRKNIDDYPEFIEGVEITLE